MRFHHRKAKFRNAQNRFCNRFCNKMRDRTARMMRARWAQRDEIHGECLSQCLKEMPTMFPRIGAGFGARLENGTLWNRQAFASLLLPAIGRVTMFASFQNWVVKNWLDCSKGWGSLKAISTFQAAFVLPCNQKRKSSHTRKGSRALPRISVKSFLPVFSVSLEC